MNDRVRCMGVPCAVQSFGGSCTARAAAPDPIKCQSHQYLLTSHRYPITPYCTLYCSHVAVELRKSQFQPLLCHHISNSSPILCAFFASRLLSSSAHPRRLNSNAFPLRSNSSDAPNAPAPCSEAIPPAYARIGIVCSACDLHFVVSLCGDNLCPREIML